MVILFFLFMSRYFSFPLFFCLFNHALLLEISLGFAFFYFLNIKKPKIDVLWYNTVSLCNRCLYFSFVAFSNSLNPKEHIQKTKECFYNCFAFLYKETITIKQEKRKAELFCKSFVDIFLTYFMEESIP